MWHLFFKISFTFNIFLTFFIYNMFLIIKTLYSNMYIRIHHRDWMQSSLCVPEIFLSGFF
jgi:hypothetical protein